MEGKSGPPEKRRIAHETKKGKRKGNSGPSGSRESHAEAKLRIRHPDDLPPMCRRENTHSTTTPDSSPLRGRTKGKKEECGRRTDGVFTPKQRARQLQQNFARGILSACIRPSQKNLSDWTTLPTPATTNAREQQFCPPPHTNRSAFCSTPAAKRRRFCSRQKKKKSNASNIFSLLKSKNKKTAEPSRKQNS